MKIFNPIGITITLGVHLLVGGVLLFTQGCQSSGTPPEPAVPPPVIPASALNQQPGSRWSNDRLAEPSRPGWAQQTSRQPAVPAAEDWNPPADTFPDLNNVKWENPPVVPQTPEAKTPAAPASFVTHTVVRGDSLSKIARQHGVSLADLRAANGLTNDTIRVGAELTIPVRKEPSSSPAAPAQSGPSEVSASGVTHKVVAGDTLSRIARKYGVSIADLRAANGLTNDTIRLGRELVIPQKGSIAPSTPVAVPAPASPAGRKVVEGETLTHKVESGEVLSSIARKYGTTTEQIMRDNGISDARRLQIGQELVIRGKAAAVTTPATTPASSSTPEQPRTLRDVQVRDTAAPSTPVTPPPAPYATDEEAELQRRLQNMLMGEDAPTAIRE